MLTYRSHAFPKSGSAEESRTQNEEGCDRAEGQDAQQMVEQGAEQRVLQPQEKGRSEFPEVGEVEGAREAKGDRGGLGGGATVNGLGAWEVAEGGSTV